MEDLKQLKEKLKALLEKEAFKKGDFTLSSGKKSNYYLDGRVITLTPEGAYLVGKIVLEMIRGKNIAAVGGPTLGADPIVGAVAVLAHQQQVPIKTFIVRKSAKEHGTQRQVEGPQLKAGERIVLVDDVATTGKALVEAKAALDNIKVTIDCAIVIVDRQEGAAENLANAGLKLEAIFTKTELGV